jgi:hypothetical protein
MLMNAISFMQMGGSAAMFPILCLCTYFKSDGCGLFVVFLLCVL